MRLRPVILITYEVFLENDKRTVAKFSLTMMVRGSECVRRVFSVSLGNPLSTCSVAYHGSSFRGEGLGWPKILSPEKYPLLPTY